MTDVPIWVPLVSALGGVILGRFSMSKKERADIDQKNYENSVKATETHDVAYKAYVAALAAYGSADDPTMDQFLALSSTGDSYFTQIARMADTIISGRVDVSMRDATWLPKIKVAYEKLLPAHYGALQAQARKKNYSYTGKLRRSDHESIYSVAEKFGSTDAWLRPQED
ncbi:hypothetical protein [Brevundimonas sp.]|uniref:hypothetical protein n=1 Tax=Brevundimonas sp. TaxID=1871086 RepID=UPI002897F555|nr:hypothetical protein [Brevundimonas sp.]